MKVEELRKLADRGRALKVQRDKIDVELDSIKETFRKEAKKRKVGYFLGSKHFVRVSPQTTTTCDPEETYDTFCEVGRRSEFFDCCKMLVGELKSKLGETVFNSISVTDSEPYKKVSFLASIPKKYLE